MCIVRETCSEKQLDTQVFQTPVTIWVSIPCWTLATIRLAVPRWAWHKGRRAERQAWRRAQQAELQAWSKEQQVEPQGAEWHWVFWLVTILSGILTVACFVFVRETYGPVLLTRKAAKLRKEAGNPELHSEFDNQTGGTSDTFLRAIVRPTKMLLFAPIVTVMALYIAMNYGYMYLLFTTFTYVSTSNYGHRIMFKVVKKVRNIRPSAPEDHLLPMVVGTILVPVGLFIYGWAVQYKAHWTVCIIGAGIFGLGILLGLMPVQLYLAETYTIYAASAIASNTVVRSLVGAVLPSASQKLYDRFGCGWGNNLLGFIAVSFIPVSIGLLKYGARIRSNPRFQVTL
ncbi:hypothetical protein BBP40_004781 [Aspergillus hancockii]|nr:hypothetical protein BBP40_004781 [Aspergillus hancockii]